MIILLIHIKKYSFPAYQKSNKNASYQTSVKRTKYVYNFNKKKKIYKVLLFSKFYLNCIDKTHLSDDYKRFEREIMRGKSVTIPWVLRWLDRISFILIVSILSSSCKTLVVLSFHISVAVWTKNKYPFICERKRDSFCTIQQIG